MDAPDAPSDHVLRAYLDARLMVSQHPDDPSPVVPAWTAQRALEDMLLGDGWSPDELDDLFARHERAYLLALDADNWRARLADALVQSTERSLRIAQALARYRERTAQ